ncbi:hypothetical protein PGT21_001210 [Puccinia graminis f. sp. tritici]|uniref:DUF7872 domain-containing protein n=3 Tax=Puccinia graminis f. sp. tritici TaxID=56615 RepID=E3KYZ0_PUCGT|nr:uncharacterized protein PGTG_15664 [Puccinia graminis f. sp. tritici CRL 75-36-700-3]EFP89515.2 hypothetical protein PGTG_15664 [Puccinia graminis f. sp. tritici CRL 75-36-700-3]KAA1074322.1 hypothetical protein PGT21_001210 [Puccinia graminis f. sp. tritici]
MSSGVETMFKIRKQMLVRSYLIPGMCIFFGWTAAFHHPPSQIQLQSTCDPLPFTQDTWQKLNLDKYISAYPGGQNLTVNEYAATVGAKNFQCGISEWCNAGQMCHPVKGLDWYVLFAIQEWTERMNNLYAAIGFTMSLVQANLLSIVSALFPQPDNLRIFSQKTHFAMGAALASLVIGLISVVLVLSGSVSIVATWLAGLVLIPSTIVNVVSVTTRYKEVPKDAFSLGSEVNYQITSYQQQLQEALRNQTHSQLNAGVSSPGGMAGALSGGSYLDPRQFRSVEQIENELKNITVGASVAHILKSLNAFVTIGSDPCNGGGKNGAWSGDNVLSYCNSNGTMFNIITVSPRKSKVQNHIPNAGVLSSKFGITTEYLTSSAIECQQTRKDLGIAHTNNTLSTVENKGAQKCIIDLPVCDCRSPEFKKRRKHVGTVKACREAGVPI